MVLILLEVLMFILPIAFVHDVLEQHLVFLMSLELAVQSLQSLTSLLQFLFGFQLLLHLVREQRSEVSSVNCTSFGRLSKLCDEVRRSVPQSLSASIGLSEGWWH